METTRHVRASSFLFKWISVVVQQFNSVLLHDVLLMMTGQSRVHYQKNLSAFVIFEPPW